MRRRTFLATTGLASTGLLAGCSGDSTESPKESSREAEQTTEPTTTTTTAQSEAQQKVSEYGAISPDGNLVITSIDWFQDEYQIGAQGIVENISDRDYEYVQVLINFYDKEQIKIGDGLDNTSGLEANSKWRFKAGYLGSDTGTVEYFKVNELTGY
ncbi:FxLYD domain-containing protein [Halocalculus aciditolerans]|uniref:Uncharacterized protein n=1 Tax=Halocalculus aciditolerans TaxID=1383812 RepID=A0A830FI71_9EURY|nr:FxLYD domain-containing protein [Halocalculus aciditolerans]GGL55209.1 hypothetical protein GCM10009039_11660 [Halocalculus aciditolerans]